MFGILKSIVKATSSVIDIPVSIAADVVTMGGALTEKSQPYTADAAQRLVKNVKDIADPYPRNHGPE